MKVGQRLFVAVLPAVFGLFLVAALAYWGRYAQRVPELVVVVAALAAMLSLVFAWRTTRYVVARVEGLAGLSSAVATSREESARIAREASDRECQFEALLDEMTTHFSERTQEARMPLHILLSSPFGDLNENQEEMLGAAQTAVDAVDTEVRQLRKLVQLHRGQLPIVTQPIGAAELLRPPLAIAGARAERGHVQLRQVLSDTMPRVVVDAVHAQEALTTILVDAVSRAREGQDVNIDAREMENGRVRIRIARGGAVSTGGAAGADRGSIEMRLAKRLLEAQGGVIVADDHGVTIDLPAERASRVIRGG